MRLERCRDGVLVGAEIERFRMRWYHRYELEHLLARAGFEIVALYGGFDRRPYDADSIEMVVVARLPVRRRRVTVTPPSPRGSGRSPAAGDRSGCASG